MPHQHPQLGYDQITFRETLRLTMDQRAVETILKFFMARLPESDLRDLDALLEGGSLDTPQPARASTPAMDQALGSVERQEFLRIGPRARNAIRRGRLAAQAHLPPPRAVMCQEITPARPCGHCLDNPTPQAGEPFSRAAPAPLQFVRAARWRRSPSR